MIYKFIIPGRLTGLNEYINAERENRYKAAALKKTNQQIVAFAINRQILRHCRDTITNPVVIDYAWYEANRKRDLDNISFAKKFIQDALVESGVLANDGWKQIKGFTDKFYVDKGNPRVEVTITEVEEKKGQPNNGKF